MFYVSFGYYIFILLLLVVYYILPLKHRWFCLLIGSLGFYYCVCQSAIWIFIVTVFLSYLFGLFMDETYRISLNGKRKASCRFIYLLIFISVIIIPLLLIKIGILVWFNKEFDSYIFPLGISFYTLQIISYLIDIYYGKIKAQHNLLKYMLFVSFFPQIIQGPIPRYEQLGNELFEGHRFDEKMFSKGLQLIIWGFFLKLMVADKAGIIVDTIFYNFHVYKGCYILVAGFLYSIQLYTDFLACVTISQGVSSLFGVRLTDNFRHPYQAVSIKDFWRRWHISLSSWLRDYVYIPLGGGRKGRLSKYKNLIITFVISGLWHGVGYKYIFWGFLNAFYQIIGEITLPVKDKVYQILNMPKGSFVRNSVQKAGVFFWLMLAWIIFRADNLKIGIDMIASIFTTYNPWIFFDDSLFELGLIWKECIILIFAIIFLLFIETKQEKISVRDLILEQHIIVRWFIYIIAISVIWIFGTYGFGFNASDFIYGGF